MTKLTTSGTLIIPCILKPTDPIINVFKQVNKYIMESLEDLALSRLLKSGQLLITKKNQTLFECQDPEIFQKIY